MLHTFIESHREELIARSRAKVAARSAPQPTEKELKNGLPLFLDQLVEVLRAATPSAEASGAIDSAATAHGGDLLEMGFTVSQVVQDYGDMCQVVTELAMELDAPIATDEFQTFNRCLDDAIAGAVTEYVRLRDRSLANDETQRRGVFAHELRNRLSAATLSFAMIQKGTVPVGGSVGAVVTRNLKRLQELVERSLLEVRLQSGITQQRRVSILELVEEAKADASLAAEVVGITLDVAPAPPDVDVWADPHILAGTIANLLQNAFKFTPAGKRVTLKTSSTPTHVTIEIEDQCGGLPAGMVDELFDAFRQRGANRRGLGLGLFISRQGIEANAGVIGVRDVPGSGCVFTVELPRMSPPS